MTKLFTKLVLLIISIFAIGRLFFLHPTFSDENFYFNVAKNIAEDKTLYKDFFFAHPPFQVYALALFFKVFGASFLLGKILMLIISSACVFLIYLISKELYDERTGFVASLIFLVTPAFIAFSTMGYGMWETLFLVLFSTYLIVKNRLRLAGIVLVASVFFRYLALIYFPFLLMLLHLRKQKLKNFLVYFFLPFGTLFILFISLFGLDYVDQTISYHIFSKMSIESADKTQYWGIGYFFFFLALLSAFVGYTKWDKILLLLASTPLIADLLILAGLRIVFYHYFLISLTFCTMAVGRVFFTSKDLIVRTFIPIVLFLSLVSNIKTIDFYLNPVYAEKFYYIAEFVRNKTSEKDAIFGEPVMTNYVAFVSRRRISSNYLDSYLQHLTFEGEKNVIDRLKKDMPKLLIEAENYYGSNPYFKDFVLNNYKLEKSIGGFPGYFIYSIKS